MDANSLINAVSNPGQYSSNPLGDDQQAQDTSLSAQGVTSNPALENFMQAMQGSGMSSSSNFGSTAVSPNPYTGAYNPVSDPQVVYPQSPTYNPNTGTYRTSPPTNEAPINHEYYINDFNGEARVTGGKEFDGWGNRVAPAASTTTGMFSSSNEGRTDLGFGMSYNMDALSNAFNPSTAGSWKSPGQSLFNFGEISLADGLGFGKEYDAAGNALGKIGQYGRLTGDRDLYGKSRDARQAMGMFGMTGNRAWDMGTKGTVLEYANDPLTPRNALGAAVNKAGFGYGGLTMTGLDYLQGYNPNTGSLMRSGAYALNPLVGGVGDLFNAWDNLGTKAGSFTADPKKAANLEELNKGYYSKYNDNFGTYSGDADVADYLGQSGLEKGTHQYDMAVQSYNMAMNKKNPYGQGFRDNMAQTRAQTSARAEMDKQVAINRQAEAEEAARVEAERVETQRVETARVEAQRVETARVEAARVEAQRQQSITDGGWGGTDISEGTSAGDYFEGGFSKADMDFATSYDNSSSDGPSGDSGQHDSSGGSISNDSFDNDDDAGGWSW